MICWKNIGPPEGHQQWRCRHKLQLHVSQGAGSECCGSLKQRGMLGHIQKKEKLGRNPSVRRQCLERLQERAIVSGRTLKSNPREKSSVRCRDRCDMGMKQMFEHRDIPVGIQRFERGLCHATGLGRSSTWDSSRCGYKDTLPSRDVCLFQVPRAQHLAAALTHYWSKAEGMRCEDP